MAASAQRQREKAREQLSALEPELTNLKIDLREADLMASETYDHLDLAAYDNLLVLSQGEEGDDPEKIDSETIIILLMLRNLLKKIPDDQPRPKLITEVMDTKNQSLVARAVPRVTQAVYAVIPFNQQARFNPGGRRGIATLKLELEMLHPDRSRGGRPGLIR